MELAAGHWTFPPPAVPSRARGNAAMSKISCPNCRQVTPRAGFGCLAVGLSIALFPVGLLFLLLGRKPTACRHCKFIFKT